MIIKIVEASPSILIVLFLMTVLFSINKYQGERKDILAIGQYRQIVGK